MSFEKKNATNDQHFWRCKLLKTFYWVRKTNLWSTKHKNSLSHTFVRWHFFRFRVAVFNNVFRNVRVQKKFVILIRCWGKACGVHPVNWKASDRKLWLLWSSNLRQVLIIYCRATSCQVRDHGKSFKLLTPCRFHAPNSVLTSGRRRKAIL